MTRMMTYLEILELDICHFNRINDLICEGIALPALLSRFETCTETSDVSWYAYVCGGGDKHMRIRHCPNAFENSSCTITNF